MSIIDNLSTNSSTQNSSLAGSLNTLITSNVLYNQPNSSQQATGTTSVAQMDELVKEYLLFRGFSQTLKSFDHDLKIDKDRCFKADKITDQLLSYVYSYDLSGLFSY